MVKSEDIVPDRSILEALADKVNMTLMIARVCL